METEQSGQPTSSLDAVTALQHVRSGRAAAARRVTTPAWYHPLVGLTLAVMVGSGSLAGAARVSALVASLVALVALLALYRRLTGLWVNALNVPGTRRATCLALLAAFLVFAVANVFEDAFGVRGSLVAGGVLLGAGYTVFWRRVERRLVHLWQST